MIYFLCSIMSKFGTKNFGFIISFNSPLNWEEEEEEIGRQPAARKPALFPPHPSSLRVLLLFLSLQSCYLSNVMISSQGASFLLYLNDNFIFVFYLQGVGFKQRTAIIISEYSSIMPRRQYVKKGF